MRKKNVIIGILAIALIITLYYFFQEAATDDTKSNIPGNCETDWPSVYSEQYNYLITQIKDSDSGAQSIELSDLNNGNKHVLDTAGNNYVYHSLLLGRDRNRVYFGKTDLSSDNATLYYVDFDALDPLAVTEIVVGNFGPLTGDFRIVGEESNAVYIQKNNNLYLLKIDYNAEPVLIR